MKRSPLHTIAIMSISATLALSGIARGDEPAANPPAATQLSKAETRKAFFGLIDRPRVDLSPSETQLEPKDGFTRWHFTFASEAGQRVTGILLAKEEILTDGRRHPVAIFIHGTTGKKEDMQPIMEKAAAKNIIAVATDGRFHGERGTTAAYNAAIAQAFVDGKTHPMYLDTCWDIMRLMDYLQTRPDVDAAHVGLMGFSKGGVETWMTAAMDDRFSVVIPAISAQSYSWQLDHDIWKNRAASIQTGFNAAAKSAGVVTPDAAFVRRLYERLIPGIFDRFDGPQMLPMIAPRPLLIISGGSDPIMPLPSVQVCVDRVIPAYETAGASDRFKFLVEPDTKHAITPEATTIAVNWFDKWLNHAASN